MGFQQRITKIKELSDRRRLPRLGVIRLGIKRQSAKGVEYPSEVNHFVCPPEVQKIYGEKPTELDIMLPLDNIEEVFPQAYKYYGSSKGLKCQGNGEVAYCADNGTMIQKDCPCDLLESGKCKQTGTLMVMIPKVSVGGVYQIRTSSFNSIVDVNSGLDYVRALVGRFCMIPLKLRRVTTETHHDEKKQNHYTLQVIFDADIQTLNSLISNTTRVLEHSRQLQLPAPVDENPELDPADVVDEETPGQEPPPCEYPEFDKTPATSEQIKKIQIVMKENGVTDRESILSLLSAFIGRDILSSKELTKTEASEWIDKNWISKDGKD